MNNVCNGYIGAACVGGYCPIVLINNIQCNNCLFYKGCEDCAFKDTKKCMREKENEDEI